MQAVASNQRSCSLTCSNAHICVTCLQSNRSLEELDTQTNLAALELPVVKCILCHLSYSKVCQNRLCQQKYPKQGQLLKEHLARPTNYANSCQYPNQWCLYAILQVGF